MPSVDQAAGSTIFTLPANIASLFVAS
jgi:hypothetical protein